MKKYKEIENIDPVKGVSERQLFDYIKYLVNLQGPILDDDDKTDVITNVMLSIIKKMNEGVLDKFIFNNFKHYIFISVKNGIKNQFNKLNENKRKMLSNHIPIEIFIETDDFIDEIYNIDEDNEIISQFKLIMNDLNENDKTLVEMYLNCEESAPKLAKKIGKHKNFFYEFFNKLRKKYDNKPNNKKRVYKTKVKSNSPTGKNRNLKEQVLELNAKGIRISDIARQLECTFNTVKYYLDDKYRQKRLNTSKKQHKKKLINKNNLFTSELKNKLCELVSHKPIKPVEEEIKPTYSIKNKTVRIDANGQIEHIGKDILRLRAMGYTYKQIKEELNCSKSTISYHCSEGGKGRVQNRVTKWRANKKDH